MPSERLRKLEIDANHAFDQYREMYFEGGVSSVYLWDLDHGFAGKVLQLGARQMYLKKLLSFVFLMCEIMFILCHHELIKTYSDWLLNDTAVDTTFVF